MIINTFLLSYVLNGDGKTIPWTISHEESLGKEIVLENNPEVIRLNGIAIVKSEGQFYLLTNILRKVGDTVVAPKDTDIHYSFLRHLTMD